MAAGSRPSTLAKVLGLVACALAWTAALIAYLKDGQVKFGLIAAGIFRRGHLIRGGGETQGAAGCRRLICADPLARERPKLILSPDPSASRETYRQRLLIRLLGDWDGTLDEMLVRCGMASEGEHDQRKDG
jgi:hypothetical protein